MAMTRDEVKEKVLHVLGEQSLAPDYRKALKKEEADFREEMQLDDLDIVEIAMSLEETFGIDDISDEESEKIRTLTSTIDLVMGKLEKK